MINGKQASTCFHLLAGHIVYLLYFLKCQNSKWGFPYVHYCLLDPCPDASLEYAWVLPDSDGLHALHEKHRPITVCLLWLRLCFIAWLIPQTSLTFLFSLTNTVLVCCWLSRCDSDLLTICSITGGQDSLACECGCVCEPAYIRAGQGWVESKVSTAPQSALFLLSIKITYDKISTE